MENRRSVALARSDFSLSIAEEEEENTNHFSPDYPSWKGRYHCIMAYVSLFMSFATALEFCKSLAEYGIIIFVPFFFFNVFIGMPAVLVEVMIARYVLGKVTRAWSMCPPVKGILYCLIGTTAISILYDCLCSLYLLRYFFDCFNSDLKWRTCNEPWADVNCYEVGQKDKAYFRCLKNYSENFCSNLTWESSGTQYWRNHLGNTKKFSNVLMSILCLLITICLTIIINYKGIRSMEKMFLITVYIPLGLQVILTFVSFELSEALFGIKKIFSYPWQVILSARIWIDAFEDTFKFLGLARLSLSFISSHGKFTDDIIIDVVLIICGSFLFYILATFPILSVMISDTYEIQDKESNHLFLNDAEKVVVAMSEALLHYPYPAPLWAAFTYLNWFLLSTGSQAILVLAFCETLLGMSSKLAKFQYFITIFSVLTFLISVFIILLKFDFNWNFDTINVTIVFLFTMSWQLFYGISRFNNDFYFMMGYSVPNFLKFTWFTLAVLPLVGLIMKMYYKVPDNPWKHIVYFYIGIPVLIYIFVVLFQIIVSQKKITVFMADPTWGPDNYLLQKSRIIFETGTVTTEFMYRQELYRKPLMKPPVFSDQNIVQLI